MEIRWKRDELFLVTGSVMIPCSCRVKNEVNKLRNPWAIVHGELVNGDEGPAFQPRQFPVGRWKVTGVGRRSSPYLAPFFISTNAHQEMPAWTVLEGHYIVQSGETFDDWGYGLHCSASLTTLGCIRIDDESHLTMLISIIKAAWADKDEVYLVVEE